MAMLKIKLNACNFMALCLGSLPASARSATADATHMQESLRRYSVVPVVVRELQRNDVLCGYTVPRGSHVVTALKAVHQQWKDPETWRPERFMPGGEFDQFPEDIRQYMVCCQCCV